MRARLPARRGVPTRVHGVGEVRRFRLDRIRSRPRVGERGRRRVVPGGDPAAFVRERLRGVWEGEPSEVVPGRIRMGAPANGIRSRVPARYASVDEDGEEACIVTTRGSWSRRVPGVDGDPRRADDGARSARVGRGGAGGGGAAVGRRRVRRRAACQARGAAVVRRPVGRLATCKTRQTPPRHSAAATCAWRRCLCRRGAGRGRRFAAFYRL